MWIRHDGIDSGKATINEKRTECGLSQIKEEDTLATIKKRNNRYAFEWYVRERDEWYWKRTQRLIEEKKKEATTLVVASAVASVTAIIISAFSLLHKS